MVKWKAVTVQAAVISGLILLVMSLGSGLLSIYKESRKATHERMEKLNNVIIDFSERARKASRRSAEFDLSPGFGTLYTASETLRKFNDEASAYDTELNLDEVYRYISMYGRREVKDRFSNSLNSYADSHAAVNKYLISVLNDGPKDGAVKKYIELVNARGQRRAELHGFIISLNNDDFSF